MPQLARSYLYVPGDRPDRVVKALSSSADAVIVDLEDAVTFDRKDTARSVISDLDATVATSVAQVWVRIGAGHEGRRDLQAVASCESVHGLVLAKCDSPAWIDEVAAVVGPQVLLSPLIESAVALGDVHAIAQHPRTHRLQLGEVDMVADLGGHPPGADVLVQHARVAVVVASAAAGIAAPVGGVHLAIDDLDSLQTSSLLLRQMGFGARALIHPKHCDIANVAFAPSADEVAWAEDTLARAGASTGGALRAADDSMIDEAVLRRARAIVAVPRSI